MVFVFGLAGTAIAQNQAKPLPNPLKILWLDNDTTQSSLTSKTEVALVLDKAKDAGFNVIVPAARSSAGVAYYDSQITSRAAEIEDFGNPPDFDLLRTVIEEAHARNLHVHAGVSCFIEGVQFSNRRIGAAVEPPEWHCVYYDRRTTIRFNDDRATFPLSINSRVPSGFALFTSSFGSAYAPQKIDGRSTIGSHGIVATCSEEGKITAIFSEEDLVSTIPLTRNYRVILATGSAAQHQLVTTGTQIHVSSEIRLNRRTKGRKFHTNPAHPEVRKRCLAVVKEILSSYDVDGVILDRVGFNGLITDFSHISRTLFEKDMKVKVKQWPEDIYIADPFSPGTLTKGPLFERWILWRAQLIHDFINDVHGLMKGYQTKKLGVLTQSPNDPVDSFGVNWATAGVDLRDKALRHPPGFSKTAFAQMVDFLAPDLEVFMLKDNRKVFEGSIDLAIKATGGTIPLAPKIRGTVGNEDFEEALRISIQKCGGVMVYSHSSLDNDDRWEAARRGLDTVPQLPER